MALTRRYALSGTSGQTQTSAFYPFRGGVTHVVHPLGSRPNWESAHPGQRLSAKNPHAGRRGGHRLHSTGGNECLLAVPVARASRLRRHSFMGTWAWSCLVWLRSGMVRSLGVPALAVKVNGPRLLGRSNAEWLCGSRWV